MGSGGGIGGFFSAVLTAVVVAAAVYFSGGTALAAIGWGAAAGAVSLIATSMLGQVGVQSYGDVTDTLSRSTSPTTGLPVLYGGELGTYILTGTIVSWYNIPNGNSQYLFSEQAVCMTGVEKNIKQIYIDNEPVLASPITEDGIVPREKILSKYSPYLQLEVRFGGDYTTTKELAKQYAGDKWTDNFLGKGIVSISAVILKTQDSLENSILVNDQFVLTAEMKGQVITDLTNGNKLASSNPPSIIYDYLTNVTYGMGIDPDLIDMDTFMEAAEYCKVAGFHANGSISYQSSYKENIENILQSFGGIIYVHGGQICLTIDRKTISVASFDESNTFDSVQVSTSGSTDYFNTIDAKYTNTTSMYSTDVLRIPSDISQDEVIRSDGQVITLSRDYTWVYDKSTLATLVNAEIRKAKYSLRTVSFNTSEGWDLKVWDSIDISNDELEISGKFKVLSKEIATDQENVGYITISAVEYPDAIFDGNDAGTWSPSGSINRPQLTVIPPTNLNVVKKGNAVGGSIVILSWDASIDPYVRGYYVYYKLATSNEWSYAGNTPSINTSYEIFGLDDNVLYDFAVSAYNNLGLVSTKLTRDSVSPTFNFELPPITGLVLSNKTESDFITDSSDFDIAWDSQKNIRINDRAFSDYFKYYTINVYNGTTLLKTFYTQNNSFNYTLAINETKVRKPTIGIIAQGFNNGTFSQEVKITVENKQCRMAEGVKFTGGFNNLFAEWTRSTERDYAGAAIIITSTNGSQTFISNKPEFDSVPNVTDGDYKVKMGFFDVFGTDNIQYSSEQDVTIQSEYNLSPEDLENIKDLIDLSGEINDAVEQAKNYTDSQIVDTKVYADQQMQEAIDLANSNTATVVQQSKVEMTNEFDTKITAVDMEMSTKLATTETALNQKIDIVQSSTGSNTAAITDLTKTVTDNNTATTTRINTIESSVESANSSITNLTQTVTDNNAATSQEISLLDSKFTGQINTTNSNVTNLTKTVTDNNTATAQSITNLDTKFTGQISTTNSNVTNLSNAVSTQNAANANQFTLISSELNGNLFINPNADTTLPNDFDYNAVIVNVSEWPTAPTTNVYKVSGRDAIGTKAIPVTGGDTFNLSMFTATDIPNVLPVGIGLYVYDKNSNIVGYYYAVRRAASDQWVKIEGTVTIPIGGSHARVWVQIDQGHTGSNHWYVTGIQCSNANIYNKVNAQITQLNSTMVTADQANATAINQVQTNLNNNTATVNQKIDTSINTLTNNINSTYSLTAQANGVVSGIKLVANSGASTNSAIYFVADKFVVSPSASTANAKSPFTIDSGVVYLNNAMIKNASIGNALIADASITNAKIVNASINTVKIQDGTITNAKIANGQINRAKITDSLQSDNYVANRSGMSIDFKNGSISINGNNSNGRMKIDNNSIQLIDSSGRVLLEMGIG